MRERLACCWRQRERDGNRMVRFGGVFGGYLAYLVGDQGALFGEESREEGGRGVVVVVEGVEVAGVDF